MNNQEILQQLDEYVVGHETAKKALIALITRSKLRHYQKYISCVNDEYLLTPMKILLMGSSGSGKTHLLESLRRITPFPLVRIDATQLMPAGASGGINPASLVKMIGEEVKACLADSPLTYFSFDGALDQTVVFIDEIDKLSHSWEGSGNWNRHVQSNFLTLFDHKNELSGVSFIFAGAFSALTDTVPDKNQIGFSKSSNDDKDISCLDDRLVKHGLIPELVGRLTHIIELDKFTVDVYYHIITTRLLPKKYMDMAAYGVLEEDIKPLSEQELRTMAKYAHKSNLGVRALQRELDKHFLLAEFDAGLNLELFDGCFLEQI